MDVLRLALAAPPAKKDETCKNCKWYVANKQFGRDGECRRYPPSVPIYGADGPQYTPVDETSWCGEFSKK